MFRISRIVRKLFAESLATIWDAKYFVLVAFLIYLCAALTGSLFPEYFSFLKNETSELAGKFGGINAVTFLSGILIQNLIAAYMTSCIISIWGLVPVLVAILNGLLLGWSITKATLPFSTVITLLLPHGIFEWPAMSIGWGIGTWKGLGYRFSPVRPNYRERFKKANIVYFTVILPLLLVAAIIETRFHIYRQFVQ
jgi:stage II sporulation protein M